MATQIFNNLCVQDLEKSKSFYASLGFFINPQFSDDTSACVVISDTIFVMLATPGKFAGFTTKKVVNAHESTEVLMALSFENRQAVDDIAAKVLANGGAEMRLPQDLGFMYNRALNDPDGHIWEMFYMDMSQFPQQ